ncbi:hypothetical protein [Streptantibioticus ferralitis]|uniref:Copper chaperone PCu(A)C n=1 Tax=Streptantibioticus ferralitis TaxID=236510 RepID=A0ABT5YTK1_9ACTN|nr:hypothetical protein [Streptantibioticus ferralitis]MDF2254933.1 hypothetical protein [Streptantibioticus ferralitis]
MTRNGVFARTSRAAVVSAAIIGLGAGCSGGQSQPSAPATSSSPTTPGELVIQDARTGTDLAIHDAVAHIGPSGTGQLTMTLRNNGSVPEHLAMLATADGGRATLRGGSAANGSLSTAGILLRPGTTITFGSQDAPSILLPKVNVGNASHTLPLTLQFGVAGLVHLQARVATR